MIDLRGSRFTDIMPENLASQLETQAFAYAIGRQIEKLCAYADGVHIYAAVDAMPEKILDYLAAELRTPVYRQYFSLEVKRKLIAATIPYYAHLGTPAAVDLVINAIFTGGHVQEWFEYEGEPHHFRVSINVTGRVTQLAETEEMRLWVGETKRLSSWLDEIRYVMEAKDPAIFRIGGGVGAIVTLPIPQQPDNFRFKQEVSTGGSIGMAVTLPVPEKTDTPEFATDIRVGGSGAGLTATIPVPECQEPAEIRSEMRTGGACSAITTTPVAEAKEE